MFPVPTGPFPAPRPIAARLTTLAGPPSVRLVSGTGVAVLALPNRYSVTYLLLSKDSVGIVDAGSNEDVPRILDALRWLGRPRNQVRFVAVSHFHFDHVMGVETLANRLGCPIAVSRPAFDAFHGGAPLRLPTRKAIWPFLQGWAMQGFPFFSVADWQIVRRFLAPAGTNPMNSELMPLDHGSPLPGLPGWRTLITPGHCDSAMTLYHRRAGFLVTGDTVRNFQGGEWNPIQVDHEAMLTTRAMLTPLPIRAVFPGHGPVLEGADLMARLKILDP